MNMQVSQKMRALVLWLFAIITLCAVFGKALHSHSEDYWQSLVDTEQSADNGMSDVCPICHFQLFFFLTQDVVAVAFLAIMLLSIISPPVAVAEVEERVSLCLRAPPVM